jgi:hypothetical protein
MMCALKDTTYYTTYCTRQLLRVPCACSLRWSYAPYDDYFDRILASQPLFFSPPLARLSVPLLVPVSHRELETVRATFFKADPFLVRSLFLL